MRFAERCQVGQDEEEFFGPPEEAEDEYVRAKVLAALVANETLPEGLKGLILRNLQSCVLPDEVVEFRGWEMMLKRLSSLALWVTSKCDVFYSERDLTRWEVHRFYQAVLKRRFVLPVREHLMELKLGSNEIYWGAYPFLDLRDPEIHFPLLKTMVLRRMAFLYDWQLEWILSHAKTLESLVLDDCPIVKSGTSMKTTPHYFEVPSQNFFRHDFECFEQRYPARWHDFRRFKDRLPHLRHFAIRTWHVQYPLAMQAQHEVDSFDNTDSLKNDLQVSRYRLLWAFEEHVAYHEVQIPDRYVEDWDAEGFARFGLGADRGFGFGEQERRFMEENKEFPDCWREDGQALGELMEVVK